MTYPTSYDYISAIVDARKNCRTTRLQSLKVRTDGGGSAIYSHFKDSLVVIASLGGTDYGVRLFLSHGAKESYKAVEGSEYFSDEIVVVCANSMAYFDLVLEPSTYTPASKYKQEQEAREGRKPYFSKEQKWGFVDEQGEVVVEAEYDDVEPFCEGRAVVTKGGCYGLIDRDGKLMIPTVWEDLSYDGSHLCYVDQEGRRGVIDRNGRVVLQCQWDWVAEESCGLFMVEKDEMLGYVSMSGEIVIELQYNWATSFDQEGIASVKKDGMSYKIDTLGRRISPVVRGK